jgi:antitoxin (DNA-binding transcriptional repressor) of toxin-antitoxin stability system
LSGANLGATEMNHMKEIEIQEVDNTLAILLDEITATESEIVITRNGIPVARIVRCENANSKHNYPLRGMPLTIAEDFDEPMSELWEALVNDF